MQVKPGQDDRPVFRGPFAGGPLDDRFVYLSWWPIERGDWINRGKGRLGAIDWPMIRASREQGRPITADMTGRGPGETTKPIGWYLGDG